METYRVLLNISYKGKRFKVLSNKYYQKYFLRILDDGSLMYPTFDEFKELYQIYTTKKYYDIKKDEDKIVYHKDKGFTKQKKLKLDPKVIIENTLCSLSIAICAVEAGLLIQAFNISASTPKQISDGVYILEKYTDENGITAPICSFSEFAEKLDVKDPSYEQVKELIEQKDNLSNKYKEWLITGLDNIEQKLGDIDLSVLYYNISRMNIIDQDYDEMRENSMTNGTIAYFDPETGIVAINEDEVDCQTLCHEVLGHGISEAYNEGKAYTSSKLTVYSKIEQYGVVYSYGMAIEEAKAEMIGEIASGIPFGEYNSSYNQSMEFVRVCMETTGVTLQDLIQKGVPYLIEKMKENDINYPIDHIENMDAFFITMLNSSDVLQVQLPGEEFNFKTALGRYMLDYVDDKITEGGDVETLSQEAFDIVNDSYFEYVTDGESSVSMASVAALAKNTIEVYEYVQSALPSDLGGKAEDKVVDDKVER